MSRSRVGAAGPVCGVLILAGCVGQGYRSPAGAGGLPAPAPSLSAAAEGAAEARAADDAGAPLLDYYPMPSPWRMVLVGAEVGIYSFTDDDISEWFDDAVYGGMKLAWKPGLNWGFSLSAGYYRARGRIKGGEDIEVVPVRATFERGGLLFFTQSRWFVGAGPGFAYMDNLPSEDKIDLWPSVGLRLDSEWTAHAVCGFEFRNESIMALRAEGGYTWLLESDADAWMVTGTLSLQF